MLFRGHGMGRCRPYPTPIVIRYSILLCLLFYFAQIYLLLFCVGGVNKLFVFDVFLPF